MFSGRCAIVFAMVLVMGRRRGEEGHRRVISNRMSGSMVRRKNALRGLVAPLVKDDVGILLHGSGFRFRVGSSETGCLRVKKDPPRLNMRVKGTRGKSPGLLETEDCVENAAALNHKNNTILMLLP